MGFRSQKLVFLLCNGSLDLASLDTIVAIWRWRWSRALVLVNQSPDDGINRIGDEMVEGGGLRGKG